LNDLKLDAVAFIQRAKSTAIDRRVMNEDVGAIVLRNETITLLIIEPFDGTSCHVGLPPDMGERCAATAARRRLKTALASVYRYAVPSNLTEIMRTAVNFDSTAQITNFYMSSQEVWAKFFAKCDSARDCQTTTIQDALRAWERDVRRHRTPGGWDMLLQTIACNQALFQEIFDLGQTQARLLRIRWRDVPLRRA
jgi:hypothetical protein